MLQEQKSQVQAQDWSLQLKLPDRAASAIN